MKDTFGILLGYIDDVKKRHCCDRQLEFELLFQIDGTPSIKRISIYRASSKEVGNMTCSSFPRQFNYVSYYGFPFKKQSYFCCGFIIYIQIVSVTC